MYPHSKMDTLGKMNYVFVLPTYTLYSSEHFLTQTSQFECDKGVAWFLLLLPLIPSFVTFLFLPL